MSANSKVNVQYRRRNVTPSVAEKFLKANTHNRPIRPASVDAYAADMLAGEWHDNGETIKFDYNGTLIDGQHRLLAIVQSGVTIKGMMVVTGCAPEYQETVDTGTTRTFSDVLKLRGEKNHALLAAVVRSAFLWDQGAYEGMSHKKIKPTIAQLSRYMSRRSNADELREASRVGMQMRNHIVVPGSIIGLAFYLCNRVDDVDAKHFFETLYTGNAVVTGDPIKTLRETLLVRAQSDRKLVHSHTLALIMKGWNLYRDGLRAQRLQFTPTKEQFPIPH